MSVRVNLEIGHEAAIRNKRTADGFTHNWEVFVKGSDGADLHYYVEKVVFHLHETFPNPKRVIKEPPYIVRESGYAGFNLPIDIYLRNNEEPKKIRFNYDLNLQTTGPPIVKMQKEKHIFTNPSEEFRHKLLKGGGLLTSSTNIDNSRDLNTSSGDKQQLLNKPKLSSSSDPVKKHKIKEHKPEDSFTDLFGTPITKTSKVSPDAKIPVKNSPSGNNVKSEKSSSSKKSKSKHSPKDKDKDRDKEKKDKNQEKKHKDEKKSKDRNKDKERKDKSVKRDRSPKQQSTSPRRSPKRSESPPKRVPSPKRPPSPPVKIKNEEKKLEEPPKEKTKSESGKSKREQKDKDKEKKEHKSHKEKDSLNRISDGKEHKSNSKEPKQIKDQPPVKIKEKPAKSEEIPVIREPEKVEKIKPDKPVEVEKEKPKHKHKKKDSKEKKEKKEDKNKEKKAEKKAERNSLFDKIYKEDAKESPREVEKITTPKPIEIIPENNILKEKSSRSLNTQLINESSNSSVPSHDESSIDTPMKMAEKVEQKKKEKNKGDQNSEKKRKRKHENSVKEDIPVKIEEPPVKVTREEPEYNNENASEQKPDGGDEEITQDYMSILKDLQHKIMTLQDNNELQRVVQLIAETGHYEITAQTFDFDLCALDRDTVRRLQEFFAVS